MRQQEQEKQMKILIDLPFSTFEDFKNLGAINLGRRNGKTLLGVCLDALKKGKPIEDAPSEEMNREYVIVSFEHSGQSDLAFWGSLTGDKEKRSFSGYTFDLDSCERYTQDEIIEADNPALFYQGESLYELMKSYIDVAIKVDDLLSIRGLKTRKTVYVV